MKKFICSVVTFFVLTGICMAGDNFTGVPDNSEAPPIPFVLRCSLYQNNIPMVGFDSYNRNKYDVSFRDTTINDQLIFTDPDGGITTILNDERSIIQFTIVDSKHKAGDVVKITVYDPEDTYAYSNYFVLGGRGAIKYVNMYLYTGSFEANKLDANLDFTVYSEVADIIYRTGFIFTGACQISVNGNLIDTYCWALDLNTFGSMNLQ